MFLIPFKLTQSIMIFLSLFFAMTVMRVLLFVSHVNKVREREGAWVTTILAWETGKLWCADCRA